MRIRRNLSLAWEMARRDLAARYRGSVFGVAWSLVIPVAMLFVYNFVFSVVFKAKWGGVLSEGGFALALFAGLLVFNFFAECVQRSTNLIVSNQNLVKKVVFPVETLPLMVVLSALVQAGISFLVLVAGILVVHGQLHLTILVAPLVIFPVVLMAAGLTYGLSALSVFVRDLNQGVPILVAAAMFLSPVFYPISALPEQYRFFASMSPIAGAIESMRNVAVIGVQPDYQDFILSMLSGAAVFVVGYLFFQKTKKGFADVL